MDEDLIDLNNNTTALQNEKIISYATKGVASACLGVSSLVLLGVSNFTLPGIIIGVAVGGWSLFLHNTSNNLKDKILGKVGVGLGALTLVKALGIPILSKLASSILVGSGLGLLGIGIYCGYKFYKRIRLVKKIR